MVLNVIQKKSSELSLCKISSDVLQNGVLKKFTQVFPKILQNYQKQHFYRKPQFDKVTVQYWVSADLLFLIKKNNVGWFLLKSFVYLFRVCCIISRNYSYTFLLINLQKKRCPE